MVLRIWDKQVPFDLVGAGLFKHKQKPEDVAFPPPFAKEMVFIRAPTEYGTAQSWMRETSVNLGPEAKKRSLIVWDVP